MSTWQCHCYSLVPAEFALESVSCFLRVFEDGKNEEFGLKMMYLDQALSESLDARIPDCFYSKHGACAVPRTSIPSLEYMSMMVAKMRRQCLAGLEWMRLLITARGWVACDSCRKGSAAHAVTIRIKIEKKLSFVVSYMLVSTWLLATVYQRVRRVKACTRHSSLCNAFTAHGIWDKDKPPILFSHGADPRCSLVALASVSMLPIVVKEHRE